MSYQSIVVMAGSQSLRARLIAAAAAQGLEDPLAFVDRNMWQLVSDDTFAAAWDYAAGQANPNANPDTGVRDDVITDTMIEQAIEARIVELTPEEEPTAAPPAEEPQP